MTTPEMKVQLDAMAAFPATLKQQVKGIDEQALHYRPSPDAWSIVEIVGHIMEVEALWAGRIRQMLASDHPVFPPYDPDDVVQQRDFQHKLPDGMLITFAERRAEHIEFLRALRAPQLARTGVHAVRGVVSVADGIAILAGHDQSHSEQITINLAKLMA